MRAKISNTGGDSMKKDIIKEMQRQAQLLKPVVIIGSKGLTGAVHAEIEVALNAHELIKIRIGAEDKQEKKEMLDIILEKHRALLISSIGYVAVIYRERHE
jgi:RNA-binding protein